jgi:hypothetical protein
MSMGDLSTFYSLPVSLSSVFCSYSCTGHLHPLLSLLLGIWFFFEAIANGIVFLYSFTICSLLVYRKATDFCKLNLYLTTLQKLFMVSRSFWLEFFGSLMYRIMSSANRVTLTISLPICIPFISSSHILTLARIPELCWIGVGRVGTLVLFLTLGEMFSVFPH